MTEILLMVLIGLVIVVGAGLFMQIRLASKEPEQNDGPPAVDPAIAEMRGQLKEQSEQFRQQLESLTLTVRDSLAKQTHSTNENLAQLRERLKVIDNANQQIDTLSGQVTQLHQVLSNKTERGAFGEVQLENLVRTALPADAYQFQATLSNGKRADCLLKLPNPPGSIVIDAKFPLDAWYRLQEAGDEPARQAARQQLGVAIKKHVKDIAERYIIPGETAESACLFLPSEAVYAELHSHLRPIVDDSYRARVWIVSPTTMMATLNTVRAILRDARMRQQTAVIQAEILRLMDDITRLDTRVSKLSSHFGQAQEDIRQIQISTGKISQRGEKIGALEVADAPDDPLSDEGLGDKSRPDLLP